MGEIVVSLKNLLAKCKAIILLLIGMSIYGVVSRSHVDMARCGSHAMSMLGIAAYRNKDGHCHPRLGLWDFEPQFCT
jgi:hypothetical protein